MNKIININYDNAECPTVSGRELHEALEVKTAYKDWLQALRLTMKSCAPRQSISMNWLTVIF